MKYTNKHGVSDSLFQAITANDYDPSKSQPNVISLTGLIDAPKARLLRTRHWNELEADVADGIFRFMGSAVHDKVSQASHNAKTENLAEERIYLNCETWEVNTVAPGTRVASQPWYNKDTWFISMQWDIYTMIDDTHGSLEDHKITSAWTMVFDPQGKPGYCEQLNVEAYVLRKLGFPVTRLRNNFLFRDWSASTKLKSGADYPAVPTAHIDHQVWPDKDVECYIKMRLRSHVPTIDLKDDDIPECTETERWTKKGTWAVMKEGRVSAVKVHYSALSAQEHCEQLIRAEGPKYTVQVRKGEDIRCVDYCDSCRFCNYWKKTYGPKTEQPEKKTAQSPKVEAESLSFLNG
jgi:hypothetical protein